MELGKLSELSLILVSIYDMSISDIKSKTLGINMFTETEFATIKMNNGTIIIVPDTSLSKHFIYRFTDSHIGKKNMIQDLMEHGYTEYDISKFLDITGKEINKILKEENKNVKNSSSQ